MVVTAVYRLPEHSWMLSLPGSHTHLLVMYMSCHSQQGFCTMPSWIADQKSVSGHEAA